MANFDEAIQTVLKHEGGFADDKNDPGGATKYGISSRFILSYVASDKDKLDEFDLNKNNYIDPEDIKHMDKETAIKIYRVCWWDKYKYEKIQCQKLATKVFDLSVNMGPYQAHKLLQRAINLLSAGYKIEEDGLIGKKTINATNITNSFKLIDKYKILCGDFYRKLCKKNENLLKYLNGWLNRVND